MLVFFPVSPLQPKLPVSLVNVIDKAVKAINFIKSQLLHACLFNILSNEIRSKHKALMHYLKVQWMFLIVSRKAFWDWLRYNWTSCFFSCNTILFQRTTDKLLLFRCEYLTDIFLKTNEVNLSLQETTSSIYYCYYYIFTKDKTQAFRQKLEFWKLVSATMNWIAFPY